MKVFRNYFLIACALLSIVSCEEDDKLVQQVLSDFTSGTFLRTRSTAGNPFNAFVSESPYSVTMEMQTADDQVVEVINLYYSFQERQFDDGVDRSVADQLFTTFDPTTFETSSRGLPEFTHNSTLGEIAGFLGLTSADYTGGDAFTYRFEVVLADGRTFTAGDASGTAAGSTYYRTPYAYPVNVTCIPTGPVAGDYLLEMQDSYGDGWNGASVRVTIDGVATDYFIADGSSDTATITIPAGATTAVWEFVSGDWDSEITFQITGPNGDAAYSDGPSPAIGELILSLCP